MGSQSARGTGAAGSWQDAMPGGPHNLGGTPLLQSALVWSLQLCARCKLCPGTFSASAAAQCLSNSAQKGCPAVRCAPTGRLAGWRSRPQYSHALARHGVSKEHLSDGYHDSVRV